MNSSASKSNQDAIRARCFPSDVPYFEFAEEEALACTICERFDQVVQRFPQNLALKSRSRCLTYSELDSLTNGLAQGLRRLALREGERIGLLFNHSVLAIIAQIGSLKAGYTRVDLSLSLPPSRLRKIMADCDIRYLITRSKHVSLARTLVEKDSFVINLEEDSWLLHGENPQLPLNSTSISTVSFTSGSTGEAKQMIRDHRNELHSIMRVSNSIGIHSRDRMLFTTSGVAIPFHALAYGACYYPTDLRYDSDLVALIQWLRDEKISVFRTPVSTFRALCWSLQESDEFPDLRLVILQGEPIFRADVEAYKQYFPDTCILVGTLGVSEFGDFAHFLVDKSSLITTPTVPGGYALTGVELTLIKNDEGEGAETGEIAIGGRFVSESTSVRLGSDFYNTGDLGRIGEDGCIFHAGRKDFQVKIRGNRVDILAVEAALLEREGISQAAVIGRTDASGDVSLVGYIESSALDTNRMREELQAVLPPYMVPALWVCRKKLPRTATGKIDRTALPEPPLERSKVSSSEAAETHLSELSETTRCLMDIWKEVLQLDQVHPDDLFFDIGGDSLKAMRVLARVKQELQVRLNLRLFFEAGTLRQLANEIETRMPD